MKILITGGAGYIGSHTCHTLYNKGYDIVVYDNLEYGHKESLPKHVKLVVGELSDTKKLNECFKEGIDGVIHFANYALVEYSMKEPVKYFKNNISDGINLLNVMLKNNVKNIVFSSSCAVYGQPKEIPIKEDFEKKPINNYGWTKLMFEEIMKSCKLNSISLRYFNAAGAGFGIGEDHDPETHLIPMILKNKEIKIYGSDYNTKDGSCIRDYIHVLDLADIHLVALESLFKGISGEYNVGTGKGTSVLEIIKICEEITGMKINKIISERREGDPAELVGDVNKMYNELGWRAKYDIKDIIKSAWEWHKNNPKGFIK